MALHKKIKQKDGVTTDYHRILFIQITVNRRISIAVLSYVDGESREREKDDPFDQPYCKSVTYETDYDENMNIESAYKFLKTLPEFMESTDI